ncbi:MAG: inorganic phosphate transporter, partial [Candidatus Aenigmarchaeota archaeon]|nr:inorganic phosphate transporter [Candidatus Aenigmarchaeota archaeon]
MDLPPLIFILTGLYVGWSIGANDVANAIGPPVGSGLISYKKAVMLFAVFAVVGGAVGGHDVMRTVGTDMASKIPDVPLLIAMMVPAILVTLTSRLGIPVSASQSIVSGLTGAAIASNVAIDWSLGKKILLTWVALPVAAVILAPTLYSLLKIPMRRVKNLYRSERILGILLLAGSCYISFTIGANNAG